MHVPGGIQETNGERSEKRRTEGRRLGLSSAVHLASRKIGEELNHRAALSDPAIHANRALLGNQRFYDVHASMNDALRGGSNQVSGIRAPRKSSENPPGAVVEKWGPQAL